MDGYLQNKEQKKMTRQTNSSNSQGMTAQIAERWFLTELNGVRLPALAPSEMVFVSVTHI